MMAFMVVPLVGIRFAYMAFPSLWLAVALWLAAGAMVYAWAHLLRQRAIPLYGLVLVAAGVVSNGLVMLVNGGVMPVIGMSSELDSGTWRSAEHGGHLLFLADRMSLAGASPGDLLILAGIFFSLSVPFIRATRSVSRRLRLLVTQTPVLTP